MLIYHTQNDAYADLTAEDDKSYVGIGYKGMHNVYRFDWNSKSQHGVLNFLYHSWYGGATR